MLAERDEDILNEDAIAARLLYRDGLMLVVDKPAGLPVHAGPLNRADKSGAHLEQLLGGLRFGLPRNPSLAHRLDRDTSGCLVLGRHHKALEKLGLLFKQGKIDKTYWAVVDGGPDADEGLIDLALGRRDASRGWWMKVDPLGQPSLTRWRVMARGGGRAALALEPLTGRTHQLRVHCSAMGWPIVGDPIYGQGDGTQPPVRQPALQLHAREIRVPLYRNREAIVVTAPVPRHMRAALDRLGVTQTEAASGP